MRVTQSMLSNNMLRNLNTSYGQMSKLQNQINSGKLITRASEDPVVAVKGMGYRIQLGKVDQFIRNTNEMNAWLDTTDESLGQVGDALNRVKELVIQAANDTNTADDRAKVKAEIDQIREQMRDLANTKVGEKSIFTGTNTLKPLYVDVTYYKPEAIQAYYDGLSDNPIDPTVIPPVTEKEQFLNNLDIDASKTLAEIKPPLEKVSTRVLNTTYEDLEGNTVNQLDRIKEFQLVLGNTSTTGPNAAGATPGTTVTETTNGNEVTTVTTTVGETETTVNTVVTRLTDTEASVKELEVTAGNTEVKIEVFDGIQLTANFPGADVFGRLDEMMGKISEALDPTKNPNHDDIQALLGGVADPTGQNKKDDLSVIQGFVLAARADIGARQNRLELMENRLDIHKINVTKQMSENEDADYAKTITEMTTAEAIHQASLSVGAKIIQQTLVDFIR